MSSPDFDFDEGIVNDSKAGGGGSSGPTIPEVDENTVEFILDVLESKGSFELPAFSRDADGIPEKYAEHYGLDSDLTLSVQDLFGQEWDETDFVGTEPLAESDDLSDSQLEQLTDDEKFKSDGDLKKYVIDPEYADEFRDATVDDSSLSAISRGINAYHNDDIVERFGGDSRVTVAIGKKRNNNSDAAEQRRNVHFSTSDAENAADKREKWAAEVSDEDEEEDEEEEEEE